MYRLKLIHFIFHVQCSCYRFSFWLQLSGYSNILFFSIVIRMPFKGSWKNFQEKSKKIYCNFSLDFRICAVSICGVLGCRFKFLVSYNFFVLIIMPNFWRIQPTNVSWDFLLHKKNFLIIISVCRHVSIIRNEES